MEMKRNITPAPYTAPSCRVGEVCHEQCFLQSDLYGEGGKPGGDLLPWEEWEL
jgi:hypothetical protein